MEASRVYQADKHEREKSMRNSGRLRDPGKDHWCYHNREASDRKVFAFADKMSIYLISLKKLQKLLQLITLNSFCQERRDECLYWLVYESLKKFHKMGLSFKVVDAAGIGITVSRLQDHVSKEVKQIANMIIGPWMRRSVWGPVL
ncbi:transcription elongation factor TFIIS/CRSP70 [Tanacetum coccineum]